MSVAILLALGAMVTGAVADLVYKGAQKRGITASTFIFYQSSTFTLTIWILALTTGQVSKIIAPTWIFGLPGGLLGYLGLLLFVMSLKEGHASINVPIFRLSFVVTAVIAILVLHESVTYLKALGILLAIVAVLSLGNLTALRMKGGVNTRSLLLVLGAVLAFGVAGVLNKEATNQGSLTIPLITVSTITFNASAFLYMAATGKLKPNGTTLRLAPFIGLLQLAWSGLLIQSLQTGDASVSFPIVQMSFVLTAILAVVVFREAVNRRLVLGLSVATLAVLAFALA